MNFLKQAQENGSLIVCRNGIYLSDETGSLKSTGRYKIKLGNNQNSPITLLPADAESLWTAYFSGKEKSLEKIVQKEAKNFSKEEKISAIAGCDAGYFRLLKSCLFDICHHLNERSDDEIANLLLKKKKPQKDFWLDFLESRLAYRGKSKKTEPKTMHNKKTFAKKTNDELISFEEFFADEVEKELHSQHIDGIAFFDGKNYSMKKSSTKLSNKICLGKDEYLLYQSSPNKKMPDFSTIFDEYFSMLVNNQVIKRIAEENKKIGGKEEREQNILFAVLKYLKKNKTLDFGEFGLNIINKDKINIYLNIPQYALKCINTQDCYLFPASKVAVSVYKNEVSSEPFLLGDSYSPFIHEGYGTDEKICMGGAYSYTSTHNLGYPLTIVKYLHDAKKIILHGYRYGANPYRQIYDIYGKVKKISKEELKKRKIPITNE